MAIVLPQQTVWVEYEIFMTSFVDTAPFVFLFLLDYMRLRFMRAVCLISSVVLIYRTSYMAEDQTKSNFILLVFLFVVSMLLMVLSPNLVSILVG